MLIQTQFDDSRRGQEKFAWPASVAIFRDKLFVLDTGGNEMEIYLLSYPFLVGLDSDGDGLDDDVEISGGTNRNDADSDDDGIRGGKVRHCNVLVTSLTSVCVIMKSTGGTRGPGANEKYIRSQPQWNGLSS